MNSMVAGGAVDPKKPDRRDFLKAGLAAGAVVPVSAAVYFGYQSWKGNKAVKTALIGSGDEGGVLVGDHNPEFNEIVAVCDIRPTNLEAHLRGRTTGPAEGAEQRSTARTRAKKIAKYDDVDAAARRQDRSSAWRRSIIATPLNTHDVDRQDVHGRRPARPVREADGPHHRPVQGDDQARQGQGPAPLDRPPAALQHALRPGPGSDRTPASSATSSTSAPCGTATTPGRSPRATPTRRSSHEESRHPVLPSTAWCKPVRKEDADALPPKNCVTGVRRPRQVRLQGHRGTGPLAAVRQDRRRADGRTRQPPARRLLHLPRARSSRWRCRASAGSSSTAPAATTARATTASSSPSSSPAPSTRRPRKGGKRRERHRGRDVLVVQHERASRSTASA